MIWILVLSVFLVGIAIGAVGATLLAMWIGRKAKAVDIETMLNSPMMQELTRTMCQVISPTPKDDLRA